LLAGCGEYHEEKFEEVAPNETAFVIRSQVARRAGEIQEPGLSQERQSLGQTHPDSDGAAQHRLWPTDYNWMPMVKVIKVDRSPITREWTKKRESGSSAKDQAIAVESLESIGFSAGATITVTIQGGGCADVSLLLLRQEAG